MRLLDLNPTSQQRQLVVKALGDSRTGDGCFHYQITQDRHSADGNGALDIVIASDQSTQQGELDGVPVESLLAICEDSFRRQMVERPALIQVVLQLQAAMRAIAGESHQRPQLAANS